MFKLFIATSILGILLISNAQSSTVCSNATTNITLDIGQYEGGARPTPETRLSWSDLKYEDIVFQDVQYIFMNKNILLTKKDPNY
ncbi:MAG: hypothetical protein K2Q18_11460, partial [Bdellovibrionales bacterium]|nr:hypothetical protein [Bdellovibrionales bacterium]